jgi:hypothetical protein
MCRGSLEGVCGKECIGAILSYKRMAILFLSLFLRSGGFRLEIIVTVSGLLCVRGSECVSEWW